MLIQMKITRRIMKNKVVFYKHRLRPVYILHMCIARSFVFDRRGGFLYKRYIDS